jgi:hypothetical protein
MAPECLNIPRPMAQFFNQVHKIPCMKKILLSVYAALITTLLFAQEGGETKKVDININTDNGGGAWYAMPWVWIVGAAVFILLLVALTRGGSRRAD